MVLDTTYRSKANTKMINKLLGKPFTFIQSIKMRGIGSKRMIIDEVSPNLQSVINAVDDINYGNNFHFFSIGYAKDVGTR